MNAKIVQEMIWHIVLVISTSLAIWLPMMMVIKEMYSWAIFSMIVGLTISFYSYKKYDELAVQKALNG